MIIRAQPQDIFCSALPNVLLIDIPVKCAVVTHNGRLLKQE